MSWSAPGGLRSVVRSGLVVHGVVGPNFGLSVAVGLSMELPRPDDLVARMEEVVLRGLPCRLRLVTRPSGWSCLDIEPLEGFTHLCVPEQLAWYAEQGYRYHVSHGRSHGLSHGSWR